MRDNTIFATITAVLIIAGCCFGCSSGRFNSLSEWKEGTLDIHCINTGRGESSFFVFPDGTTMLVDAAGSLLKKHTHMPTAPKPDSTVSSGQVIIDYIRRFAPKGRADSLDYFILSHYHTDHMGDYSKSLPLHEDGHFRLSSICEIGSTIPYRRLITRGDPTEVKSSNCTRAENMANFSKFVNWSVKANGTRYEFFDPASDTQIAPVHKKIPGFCVHNIAANGRYRLSLQNNEWAPTCLPRLCSTRSATPRPTPARML